MPRNVYVVHALSQNRLNVRDAADYLNQRVEHGESFAKAFASYKRHVRFGNRVGLFYWDKSGECQRLYASDNYNLIRDTGAK